MVLVVLDGWGIGRDEAGNAVNRAGTPTMNRLWHAYPHTMLDASGLAVGLPPGQMGNSEVGHLNLGAGFVVYQWISRIDQAIQDGSFFANPTLRGLINGCRERAGTLHLIGLIGDGGVHSHTRHMVAALRLCGMESLASVAIHAITDGRDTSPTSGLAFIAELEEAIGELGVGRIATVSGRYDAMDRDRRWERTRKAYDAIVDGIGPSAPTASGVLSSAYAASVTDEFVEPTIIGSAQPIQPGDAVFFVNFRSDRGRQLTGAIASPTFDGFERPRPVWSTVPVATMTTYDSTLPVSVVFPPHDVVQPLAAVISEAGHRQLHAAETEKYPHVTFFLNGGREAPYPGEQRSLSPSPKVATYDLQPEMSAAEVTTAVVSAIESSEFAFIVVNFANGDMVGHTGVLDAAQTAIEVVDGCLHHVVTTALGAGGALLITADHGNAEEMIDRATGGPMTAHTTNPVPLVLVTPELHRFRTATLRDGASLSAVAPTVLRLLGLPIPSDMTTLPLV